MCMLRVRPWGRGQLVGEPGHLADGGTQLLPEFDSIFLSPGHVPDGIAPRRNRAWGTAGFAMLRVMPSAATLPELGPLVFAIVLLELAFGSMLCSWASDLTGRVGRGFTGTTAALCLIFLGLDFWIASGISDPGVMLGTTPVPQFHDHLRRDLLILAGATLLTIFFCAVGTDPARWVVEGIAVLVGVGVMLDVAQSLGPALSGFALTALALFSAVLMLGTALSGMLVGHWYLISPSLSFKPLRIAVYFIFAAVVVRIVVLVVSVLDSAGTNRDSMMTGNYAMPFWLLVVGAGIVFTSIVAGITFYFARIRANQPATAMLYALIVAVLMGVVPGHFVYLLTNVPM